MELEQIRLDIIAEPSKQGDAPVKVPMTLVASRDVGLSDYLRGKVEQEAVPVINGVVVTMVFRRGARRIYGQMCS